MSDDEDQDEGLSVNPNGIRTVRFSAPVSAGEDSAEPSLESVRQRRKKKDKDLEESDYDKEKKERVGECRFYENKFPEVDDLVIVEVKSIEEMGAYVTLKEYGDIEGMILLSELSRRRIRSVNKIIRVGRLEVVVVLRVDKEKGYIDLSKRRVSEEDIAKADEKYNKAKAVHSIMRHVAEATGKQLEEVYEAIGFPLYKKYLHAFDAFKAALADPEQVLEGLVLDDPMRESLMKNIRRRLTPQPVKVRADIELTCFKSKGINAIRDALVKGQDTTTAAAPIKITLVAPPLYVVVTTAINKDVGIKALQTAIVAIREEIVRCKGDMNVKVEPRTVHERDEQELTDLFRRLATQNQEVDGDNDGSGSDEES